jgi:PST family polysaccharide transporter
LRQALRAIAILSVSSIAGIAIAVVYAKVRALMLGPDGLGSMVLLQNLVTMTTIALGLGVGAAAVQLLARREHSPVEGKSDSIRVAAWILRLVSACVAVLLFVIIARPLASALVGDAAAWSAVAWIGLAVAFAMATDLLVNTLIAYQRIGTMARAAVLAAAAGSIGGTIALFVGHREAIPIALVAFAVATFLVTFAVSRGQSPGLSKPLPDISELVARARELLAIGAPYAGSQLLSSGVLLVVPFVVLLVLGRSDVAFYQAALAIGSTYPAGLINALGSDYYQRLSATPLHSASAALSDLVNQQMRLVFAVGVPVIVTLMALAPYVVPLAYSAAFLPAVALLQWTLLGDLFKFSSYTMSFAILARRQSLGFLITESVAGFVYLVSAYVGMRWYGLVGLGLSWVVTYAVYLAVVWVVANRLLGVKISPLNVLLLIAGALLVCGAKLLAGVDSPTLRFYGPMLVLLLAGGVALLTFRRELVLTRIAESLAAKLSGRRPRIGDTIR